jgi:L-lactate dehydrogenase complex protein LldG
MTSTRDELLARVRAHPLPPVSLPEVPPSFGAVPDPATALDRFRAALERMGGRWAETAADGDADALVRGLFPQARVICSAAPEVRGTRPLDPTAAPAALGDVDVGVVRARFGVAETGSVLLTEAELGVSALGFLSQHLVVLLDPAHIVADLHAAYADAHVAAASYAIFMTGPSATADIEGVLIHGAQGVRSLTVVPLPVRT